MAYKPAGYPDLSPYLLVTDIEGELGFLAAAFGATPLRRMPDAQGRITHAEARIGDSVVMLGLMPEAAGGMVHLYLPDPDAAYERAIAAGATVEQPMTEQGDGDRRGGLRSPFGPSWWVARQLDN